MKGKLLSVLIPKPDPTYNIILPLLLPMKAHTPIRFSSLTPEQTVEWECLSPHPTRGAVDHQHMDMSTLHSPLPVMSHVIANGVSTLTFKSNGHPGHAVPTALFLPLDQSFATHRPLKLSYYLATPSCLPYCHILSDRELPTSSGKNFIILHYTSSSSYPPKDVPVISDHPPPKVCFLYTCESVCWLYFVCFFHFSLLWF